MEKTEILILGSGFGGIRTALDLANAKLRETKITLISNQDFHEYHPDLYEVAAVFLPEKQTKRGEKLMFENLSGTVAIPLKEIFKGKDLEFANETITAINVKEKKVVTEDKNYPYDILVIALGSTTNYFGIPGLEEKALPLKTTADAINIRNEIDELFWRKKPGEEINLIVGGGGFTGCELAGQLVSYTTDLARARSHPTGLIHLSVVEAMPTLLGGDSWLAPEALKRLTTLGVKVHLNSKIIGVSNSGLILDGGQIHPFDILIWTAGVRVNKVVAQMTGVKQEKNACLAIGEDLRLLGFENIFALGDNSICWDHKNNKPLPATAQLAIDEGALAAKNIIRLLKKQKLESFRVESPSFVVPLGRNFALAKVAGVKTKGILAWLLKRIAALKYLLSILPVFKAIKVWWTGVYFSLGMEDSPN